MNPPHPFCSGICGTYLDLCFQKSFGNGYDQQLRIWPREIQGPFFATAEELGERGVARIVDLLAEVDRQSKSGIGEAATNVERFILQVGTTQSGTNCPPGRRG